MKKNNPYIEKVFDHPQIFTAPEDIRSRAGKWNEYFQNTNPIVLEIGTGMGNFFAKQCGAHPDKNFIGMEIRYKRLYTSIEKALSHGNNNALMMKELGQNLAEVFAPEELSECYVFFPDPYCNKKKQLKHRLFQADFLNNLHSRLKNGGTLTFKTDHREYFDSTLELLKELGNWEILASTHNYEASEYFSMDNITEFEALYRGDKIEINYLEAKKI